MSYVSDFAAVKSTLQAVSGISLVVVGFPTSIQRTPLVYLEADSGDRNSGQVPKGQVLKGRYRVTATLCVPMQDNTNAENQVIPFIDSIPQAIAAACRTLRIGMFVTRWATGVRPIGGAQGEAATMYRVVDFTIELIERDL